MNLITIEIVNWQRYNPRSDRRGHTWFRLQNTFPHDAKFFGLSAAQKFIVTCLFAEASKSGGEPAEVNIDWLVDTTRVSESEILHTIQHLVGVGVIRLPPDTKRLPMVGHVRTYERTNTLDQKHDQDTKTAVTGSLVESPKSLEQELQQVEKQEGSRKKKEQPSFDLERLYAKYPRKLGKQKGLTKLKTQIKTQADFENLEAAIERYGAFCSRSKTEPQFIKHFSSFVSEWRDWLDPDVGALTSAEAPQRVYDLGEDI